MSLSDPLGDMLARIKNGQLRKKESVVMPASRFRGNVLDVLHREGYIRGFKKVEIEVLGIVENMSFFACPKCGEETPIFSRHGAENTCSQIETQFLGAIPIEIDVRKGGDEGKPLMSGNLESPATNAFNNIADNLVRVLEED